MEKGKPKIFYQQYTQCLRGDNKKKIEIKKMGNFRPEKNGVKLWLPTQQPEDDDDDDNDDDNNNR